MKIILFTTDEIGYKITKFITKNSNVLTALVLDTKDKQGLNKKIIKASGIKNSEKIFYSNLLYQPKTLRQLKLMDLDLGVLAWWPYIIKKEIINICNIGIINFHPSLLPFNRGKDANFWTLVDNTPFGVSLHWVNEGIDSGALCFQREIKKTWEDTGETLYEKATKEIVRLFEDNFDKIIKGAIPRKKQMLKKGSFHQRKELDQASEIKLNKKYKAKDLLNLIRARTFPPHPGAWFKDKNNKYELAIKIKKI